MQTTETRDHPGLGLAEAKQEVEAFINSTK
jgi:hypothetical protein